ncbi:MAG: ABC transporter permease, partial [Leeuwenhoekiella sp.]
MLRNSIQVALRSLKGNPLFTFLNMASVVIGLLVVYIACSYLRFEKSYDTFHENSASLYRVGRTLRQQDYAIVGFSNWNGSTGIEQKRQLNGIKAVSGISNATQFFIANEAKYLNYEGNQFTQEKILATNAPAGFTEMFSWKLLAGNFDTFKTLENSVILNTSTAYKLLGNENYDSLIDAPIQLSGEDYTVAAVIVDVPKNSHFNFNIAVHVDHIDYWGSHIYVQLLPPVKPATVENLLNQAVLEIDPSLETNETYKRHFLQKVTDIHLKSNILYELQPPGNSKYIYLIGAFAILIILITLFNYANFTLALKTKQSRVIGVRKVLGASRIQIAAQILIEALVLVLLSLPILFVAIYVTVPFFNAFMEVTLEHNPLLDFEMIVIFLLITVALGVLASIAPAILISSKKTLALLKEKLGGKRFGQLSMRRYLIISQFAILIGVSSVSYFMLKQIQFIEEKDLGFKKEGILYTFSDPENLDSFQTQLASVPEIQAVGNGSAFGIETFNNVRYRLAGSATVFEDANQFYLDYDAVSAYDLKTTLAPEIFQNPSDRRRRDLINRSAAERFAKLKGVTANELIGTQIITEPDYQNEGGTYGIPITIAGIYEDINVFSLRE